MTGDWQYGYPPICGYYLAAWSYAKRVTVSELWFNPTGGGGHNWWKTRGYMGDIPRGMDGAIGDVFAWMHMPKPPLFPLREDRKI